ncbi:MAG: isocitrate/isopropylmalate dehydrogenase family protein [Deltaproteobacteria bacterium]|jgi:3-isopropylmalate dehydrogenase|nr:isocitrate/isopropylmalate dehydrogenase family protein [Deltaproteobacteria bacterium]
MNYEIAVIPGDGIGPEVVAEALKAVRLASSIFGFAIKEKTLPFGGGYYLKNKVVLPPGALDEMGAADALLLGAVGDPQVPPGPLERELLLELRFHFDQYLNLRPAKSLPGVPLPIILKPGAAIDIMVVRENTEGFYMGLGGRIKAGRHKEPTGTKRRLYALSGEVDLRLDPPVDGAFAMGMLTAPAIDRVAVKAFELARARGDSKIHVATKANALPAYYGFWDEEVLKTAQRYPEIQPVRINIDNLCYQLPRNPAPYGVILAPNLFGDIVSDLLSALSGGLGMAASGNIGDSLCMFEPIHGSAPVLVGTGRANPLAAILSSAMMLEHLGQREAAEAVREAVVGALNSGELPIELGGKAPCPRVGELVVEALKARAARA